MKIELANIFGNKPYYIMYCEDGKRIHALGYEQAKKYVEEAKSRGEQIELAETTCLDEHSELVELVNSLNKTNQSKKKNEKNKTKNIK